MIENFRPGGSGENEIAARRSWQRKNPEGLCFRPELPDSVRRSGKGKGLTTQRTTSIVSEESRSNLAWLRSMGDRW